MHKFWILAYAQAQLSTCAKHCFLLINISYVIVRQKNISYIMVRQKNHISNVIVHQKIDLFLREIP